MTTPASLPVRLCRKLHHDLFSKQLYRGIRPKPAGGCSNCCHDARINVRTARAFSSMAMNDPAPSSSSSWSFAAAASLAMAIAGVSALTPERIQIKPKIAECASDETTQRLHQFIREKRQSSSSSLSKRQLAPQQLPEYTSSQVAQHNGRDSPQIWMSYGGYVYDVTDFIPLHPGGSSRIQRAGGMAIEPHWHFHQQHFLNNLPQQILDSLIVGRLRESDQDNVDQELERLQEQLDGFCLTLEVKVVNGSSTERSRKNHETSLSRNFSLEQLQQLPRTESNNSVGCPTQQPEQRPKAVFAGVRLEHLLDSVAATTQSLWNNKKNKETAGVVVFHALDGETLEAQLEPDILICYEMDGAPLTQQRGFPLRILFPGKKRVIKWVEKVEVRVDKP